MLDQFCWELISAEDTVLVAVSGGPDSLCLLHLLWTAREACQIRVEAAHLDHGLRGDESAAEAVWVARWCLEHGIACHVSHEDVAAFAASHKLGRQEAARTVRYAFLERTAAAIGADKIATGHTQNDQVETVLANILRGTGTDGLRGIRDRRGLIVRPLLGVTRAEIEAYCQANALSPRQDLSNASPDHYTRNRIRLALLPQLRREYNPRVEDAVLRLSEIAARNSDYLEIQAKAALAEALLTRDSLRLTLDRAALAALHPALLRYVVRQAVKETRGTLGGVSYEHLEQVYGAVLFGSPAVFTLTLPSPLCILRLTRQTLTLALANATAAVGGVSVPLPVPGSAALDGLGWMTTASWNKTPGAVRVDAEAMDLSSLVVRNRRDGDKMDPLGMGGRHKKVADIFADAKVPRSERDRIPIVADRHGIVWIIGFAPAERAKVTASTVQVLYLSAQKTNTGKIRQEIAAETGNIESEQLDM